MSVVVNSVMLAFLILIVVDVVFYHSANTCRVWMSVRKWAQARKWGCKSKPSCACKDSS